MFLKSLKQRYGAAYKEKTFVCYGDFRQVPPVVPGADRAGVVDMSVKSSATWGEFSCFRLRTVHRQSQDVPFAKWIDSIGDNTVAKVRGPDGSCNYVKLSMCETLGTQTDAIQFCYPALNDPHACADSKILAARNSLVDAYNQQILHTLVQTYRCVSYDKCSSDTLDMDAGGHIEDGISSEFLNLQQHVGTPPHSLKIVEGALYSLMRNFSPRDSLMNHVPVVITKVYDHHILVTTLDGRCFPIPRICFRWALVNGTCTMTRRQYPLRPGYATSFNGAQGHTLERCVLDTRYHPFSHGHLYVATSRVRSRHHMRAITLPECLDIDGRVLTHNIVWPELLLDTSGDIPQNAQSIRKRPAARL